jgi:predicted ATPase/DNA-binding CsgD family transcriptional regulator
MARPTRRPGNLPAEVTSFIGRRRELAEVRARLAGARLVSLTGPGGVGKTRAALRAAASLQRGFRDGVWLAELADLSDPALVSTAVTSALDLRDQPAADPLALVLSYLRTKDLLLVLDNCEHLLPAAAELVTEVISAAPDVRVLATSREPLSVPGEHVVPIPPLALPEPAGSASSQGDVASSEAVRLFAERAAAASGAFEVTPANQADVAELCRRLDGMPLAIEFAAVRTRVLSAEQILGRLTDRFGLLTGGNRAALPRHQTLMTTIEWSYDLLTDDERATLRRMSVFAGRFAIDDVEAVCLAETVPAAEALSVLSSLVDKSLVTKDEVSGSACYRLHETMREFTALKLRQAGEQQATERRCTDYYASRCGRSALESRSRLAHWLAWADLEIDNVRAVLQWCRNCGDATRGTGLAASLAWFWITRATTEGIRWLDEFLVATSTGAPAYGWACFVRGLLSVLKNDPPPARAWLDKAVATARSTGQRELLAEALAMASIAADSAGDHACARTFLDEAAATADTLDYPPGRLAVLQAQALHGSAEDDQNAVLAAASRGADLARATADLYALEMMALNIGSSCLFTGDLDAAKPALLEALQIARQIDDRVSLVYLLTALAWHAAQSRQARLAARLLGAADTARTTTATVLLPQFTQRLPAAAELAAAALGPTRFEAEVAAGRKLTRAAAIALALGEPDGAETAAPAEKPPGPLSARQSEIARLVAAGLTNKQIASRLLVSERTVDSHVRAILTKLGGSSRAQIATWVTASDNESAAAPAVACHDRERPAGDRRRTSRA